MWILFLLCGLIGCSAFLSASETSLFSLPPSLLKSYQKSQTPKEQLISSLMAHPRDLLVTLLMLNMLINLLVQNTVANLFASGNWGVKVGLPLVLTLVFGEVLPKTFALSQSVRLAKIVSPFIAWAAKTLRYVRGPLTQATYWISRFFFLFLKKEKPISVDELRLVLQTSEEKGVVAPQEGDLLEGALDLRESIVKERMRPREEVFYYNMKEPLSHLLHLLVDLEISRVPVCDGSLEKMLGVISARRFFLHRESIQNSQDLLSLLKKPYFIPETMKAWTLFTQLREKKEDLAIVVDEYGSISGLITQEDLIEAVVGEIRDRRDPKALYSQSGSDNIIASGKLELSEFREIFGVSLQSEENVVTLGGWLIEQLGDIPKAGTKYATDQFLFYILSAAPNRIQRVYVRRLKPIKKL